VPLSFRLLYGPSAQSVGEGGEVRRSENERTQADVGDVGGLRRPRLTHQRIGGRYRGDPTARRSRDACCTHFSAAEYHALFSVAFERRTSAFLACWTRKGAYVKAAGDGLALPQQTLTGAFAAGLPAGLVRFMAIQRPPSSGLRRRSTSRQATRPPWRWAGRHVTMCGRRRWQQPRGLLCRGGGVLDGHDELDGCRGTKIPTGGDPWRAARDVGRR
jgi:hypothetical protein